MLVSLVLLLGRLTGFIRDWVIAYSVGADIFSDFAMVFITLPDLIVSLVVGGGFAAAMVPEFKSLDRKNAYKLFKKLFFIIGCIFSLVALLVSFFGVKVIFLLAPGIPQEFVKDNLVVLWIVTIAIPLTACSGVVKAKMDAYNLFLYGAVGTLIFNASVIFLVLLPSQFNFIESISIGILAGASTRLLVQLVGIKQISLAANTSGEVSSEYKGIDRRLILTIFSTITFSALLVILPVIARSIASANSEGALSLFTYAYRINEVPMALIIGSLVTVLVPALSSIYKEEQIGEVVKLVVSSLRATLLVCISISIPIIFYAPQIVELIFFSTKLTKIDLNSISIMLAISFLFLPFRGLLVLLFPIICSVHAAKNLGLISLTILITLILSSVLLTSSYGLTGTMLAYCITNLVGSFLLYLLLIEKLGMVVIKEVISDFKLCFLIPILFSVIINYVGVNYFSGVLAMMLFGCISCLGFIFIVLLNDRHFDVSRVLERSSN